MTKAKSVYICQNCGAQSAKWIGRCPSCNEWNTYVEEIVRKDKTDARTSSVDMTKNATTSASSPQLLANVDIRKDTRMNTNNQEFNRVLGGGIVPGSIVLIGGEPGIGKSTLALQIALKLENCKTLYISGEESLKQIKLRSERIASAHENCYFLSQTLVEDILWHIRKLKPQLVIIDSIQTLHTELLESAPGSVSQIRECANALLHHAKETSTPVILIGHINKEGSIAGPKVLEHVVDTVLQFEGDTNYMYRILRATKNRFGSTSELGIFEMKDTGLQEVPNPSELLLSQNNELLSGVAISAGMEGMRPFLIEIQALVSSAVYGTPQRTSTGFNLRRLSMLLAVLEKRAGFRLAAKDVFINIAGGIKIDDPAADLAVICAILSSNQDITIDKHICFAGEVGLSGEIRPVHRIDRRIAEAAKLGFKQIVISRHNPKDFQRNKYNIDIKKVGKVEEILSLLF